jgi:hypothetical protein
VQLGESFHGRILSSKELRSPTGAIGKRDKSNTLFARGRRDRGIRRRDCVLVELGVCEQEAVGQRERSLAAAIVAPTELANFPGMWRFWRFELEVFDEERLDDVSDVLEREGMDPCRNIDYLGKIDGRHAAIAATEQCFHLFGSGLVPHERD